MRRKTVSRAVSESSKKILQVSGNIVGTAMDAVLYVTYHTIALTSVRSAGQADYAHYQADLLLQEVNHKTIANALANCIAQGYIKRKHHYSRLELEITKEGIKRINELFPTYKTKRPWDGYIYLVSYDIPAKSNAKRNLLRGYLRRIGCGLLQESLFMTPYDPHGIIESFVAEHNIPGTILISKLGHDGSVGDENLSDLISRIYHLADLERRYEDFIKTYIHQKNPSKTELSLAYYVIVKDDPQLPFPLEPKGFTGKKAHEVFLHFITTPPLGNKKESKN